MVWCHCLHDWGLNLEHKYRLENSVSESNNCFLENHYLLLVTSIFILFPESHLLSKTTPGNKAFPFRARRQTLRQTHRHSSNFSWYRIVVPWIWLLWTEDKREAAPHTQLSRRLINLSKWLQTDWNVARPQPNYSYLRLSSPPPQIAIPCSPLCLV